MTSPEEEEATEEKTPAAQTAQQTKVRFCFVCVCECEREREKGKFVLSNRDLCLDSEMKSRAFIKKP